MLQTMTEVEKKGKAQFSCFEIVNCLSAVPICYGLYSLKLQNYFVLNNDVSDIMPNFYILKINREGNLGFCGKPSVF